MWCIAKWDRPNEPGDSAIPVAVFVDTDYSLNHSNEELALFPDRMTMDPEILGMWIDWQRDQPSFWCIDPARNFLQQI